MKYMKWEHSDACFCKVGEFPQFPGAVSINVR